MPNKKADPSEVQKLIANIDPREGVDLSTVIDCEVGSYFMFKTGGPHFFAGCSNKEIVENIYLQNIWPFIFRYRPDHASIILTGTIAKSKLNYPSIQLYHKTDIKDYNDYRNPLKTNVRKHKREIEQTMHRLTALCFCKNDDPKHKTVVDHINGNRVDYRVENLRWSTVRDNSKGNAGQKTDPDTVYQRISQMAWFNGEAGNNIKTNKDIHQAFNKKKFDPLSEFEKILNETNRN